MGTRRKALFGPRRKRRPGCLFFLLLLPLSLAILGFLNAANNRRVALYRVSVSVPGLDKSLEGLTFLHISDLHGIFFGPRQEKLLSLLSLESYQAVCMTGDMVGQESRASALLALLDGLPGEVPVFLIPGDDDPPPLLSLPGEDGQLLAPYLRAAREHGAVYLDAPASIEYKGKTLWFMPEKLLGIDLDAAAFSVRLRLEELGAQGAVPPESPALALSLAHQQESLDRTLEAFSQMQAKDLLVLLSHQPPSAEAALAYRSRAEGGPSLGAPPLLPSLVLSGHYNGGQWRLPWLGPVYVPSGPGNPGGWFPGDRGITGLFLQSGIPVHISPGLGVSGAYPFMPFRLFNTPAVTLVTLTGRIG